MSHFLSSSKKFIMKRKRKVLHNQLPVGKKKKTDLNEKQCCVSIWGCGFENESGDFRQPSVIIFTQGIHSSCCSEGSSEGWASSPGWSPGPSDPEPACGADAPAWTHMKQRRQATEGSWWHGLLPTFAQMTREISQPESNCTHSIWQYN